MDAAIAAILPDRRRRVKPGPGSRCTATLTILQQLTLLSPSAMLVVRAGVPVNEAVDRLGRESAAAR